LGLFLRPILNDFETVLGLLYDYQALISLGINRMHVGCFHEELALGALIIFLWTSFLQATTKNEFVRKFITRAWPLIVYENLVRKSIPESYFLCC
jgi:hypothetical protein